MWFWLIGNLFAETLIVSTSLDERHANKLSKECMQTLDGKEVEIRTSRFYVKGSGFEYKVVVAGLESNDEIDEILALLNSTSQKFALEIDGKLQDENLGQTVMVDEPENIVEEIRIDNSTVDNAQESNTPKERWRFKDRLLPQYTDVLLYASQAHGNITELWSQSTQEQFFYFRNLPQDGTLIYHQFYLLDEAMRLDITMKKGNGINSTTVLPDEGEGWVRTDEKTVARNAIRTKELLTRFSSKNILSVPYYLSEDINSNSDWHSLTEVKDGEDVWILSTNAEVGLVEASFHKNTWMLNHLSVQMEGNRREYEFQDYRQIEGLGMIPHIIQIYDDEVLIEEIRVEKLSLTEDISVQMFEK